MNGDTIAAILVCGYVAGLLTSVLIDAVLDANKKQAKKSEFRSTIDARSVTMTAEQDVWMEMVKDDIGEMTEPEEWT